VSVHSVPQFVNNGNIFVDKREFCTIKTQFQLLVFNNHDQLLVNRLLYAKFTKTKQYSLHLIYE